MLLWFQAVAMKLIYRSLVFFGGVSVYFLKYYFYYRGPQSSFSKLLVAANHGLVFTHTGSWADHGLTMGMALNNTRFFDLHNTWLLWSVF